nr:helix-turn-helix domain-containing protein [Leucobacter edaphi]
MRLVVGGGPGTTEEQAFDRPFEWLHATDMIDPTPFLGPAEVILTLGWQFPVTESADPAVPSVRVEPERLAAIYDDYAALVSAHGVIGIGFGSDVVHRGIPPQLAEACRRHGLILFDVPYEISFMDLLQEAAQVLQRDETERYSRSLRAQRAIANAATRRDGLEATLRETARQLDCGVALYDPVGRPITVVDAPDGPRVAEAALTGIVLESLSSGQRFRSAQVTPDVEAVLQLLGEPGEPSGMLALTLSRGLDDLSRDVMSSVLALVSVSLQQNQKLAGLSETLREALLHLILTGNASVTSHIVERLWGPLPAPPLVALIGIPRRFDTARLIPALEALPSTPELPLFFAGYRGDAAVIVPESGADRAIERLAPFELTLGRSRTDEWSGLGIALDEAKKAADHGRRLGSERVTRFSEIWRNGVSDLVDASDGSLVARRLLGPLRGYDAEHGGALLETLAVWLRHHGRPLPASQELGIHRHTLAHRLTTIAGLTGLDLDDFQARAELALALRFLDTDRRP